MSGEASNNRGSVPDDALRVRLALESWPLAGSAAYEQEIVRNALEALARLVAQIDHWKAEAERSERYAEERDLYAQRLEEQSA
jgi:hypothetical protein